MKIAYNPITAEALTTAPANNDITFDLRGLNIFVRGVKFKGTDTTYSVFKKHTSSSGGGYNGLVPVPSYTSTNIRFLREDGTWQIPSSQYTYSLLTNQDLDTLKTEGKWFYLAGGNTVTNGPTNINGGGELYVGRNASGFRYLKVISVDGLIWFRKWNSQSWSPWKRWYTDANTDSKVLQSVTTTTNYRPLVLGYNNSTSVSSLADSITQQVYTATNLYVLPSTGSLWANKLYSGGKPVLTDHLSLSNYVTLNTTLTITGLKTFTSQINSSLNTTTYLEGNKGKAIINSTAGAGQYVMLFKGNSTNGYFTHGVYLSKYLLQYTAKSTVDAGTNAVTKSVTLLDESGNSLFSGNVTAPKFIGSLLGNADSATKLTTSAGSSSLPVYFLEGKPLACSPSSLFSNLSNSGNNISVTVAGQNRTLTINYANKANKLYSYELPSSGSDKRGWYCKIASISITGKYISKSALLCITDEYTTTSNYPRYGFIYVKVQLLEELGTSPNITLRISGSLTTSLVTGILTLSSSSSKLDIYLKEDLYHLVGYVSFIHGREDIRTNSQELILTLPLGTIINSQYGDISNQTLSLLNSRKINGTSFNGTTDITTSYWGPTRTITLTGAVTGTVSTNGSGNIIINTTYDTNNISDLDSRYVNITGDTMTGELKLKYINALRLIQGNYGVIHRNDGQNYYILLTNPGGAVNGTYNPLRPLLINLSTGYITFSNTSINGGCSITGGLNLGTSSGANLKVNNTNIIRWNGLEYKNLIISSTGGTMYLRPNGDSSTDGQVTIDTNGIVLSNKFVKMGSSDSYILLGGGGHKAVSDFALASSLNNYVTLNTAQTISGVKTFSTLLKFTVANGTSPFSVTSNTLVNNLNADLLDGMHSSSFLLLLTISGTTDVSLLKDTRLYYTTSDGGSQELVNSPFNKTFSMILVTNLINGDTDWRRSAIAFNPDGEARIFNDRGTSGDGGVWYTILTSGNYSSILDTRYPTKTGGGASGTWGISISGNAATASKWATARTITLGSYLSGSVSLDGSTNVTLNANVIGLTTQGKKTAISGTTVPSSGVRLYEVYNNGYPTTYGNLLSIRGGGSAELLLAWKNTQRIYVRSKSDVSTEEWTAWKTVAFTDDNVASATAVKVSQHTTNNTNYPIVWSNLPNTNTGNSELFKSWLHLYYNPSTLKLTSTGGFIKGGSSDSYVLLGGGGHATLSGLGGSHTHTVFKNNVMVKGTNGISDSASIHLGIGDSDTGFKWISDGACQMYANDVAIGQWNSGGMNWLKQPSVNGQKIWHAGNDGSGSSLDADLLDGVHLNAIFTELNYSKSRLTATIGTVKKTVNVTGSYPNINNVTMNTIASYGNCMGMASLASSNSNVNPNNLTSWHHFINMSYDTSPDNMWQSLIAIRAGTTEVWVRSRSGGTVLDNLAWLAPWVRLARTTDNVASATNADKLDGIHANGLLTALTSNSTTNLSLTVGGTTKTIADLYATLAVNADTVDNLHASSFMRCDGTNGISLTGGNGNTSGWRLVLEKLCGGWTINNIVLSVTSRHSGLGVLSIGFHTTNDTGTSYTYSINFKGSTASISSGAWRAFYNTSTKKFRLFWHYWDYNDTYINVLNRISFDVPKNGTWYETLPTDNGTELIIRYNTADKLGTSTVGNSTTPIYLNGGTPTICSVSTSGNANTIAIRDGSGDLQCRLVRATYANQSNISGALAFRVNNSSDNYIRFCSDTAAIRSWLGVASSSHNHDSTYVNVTGDIMTGNLTFSDTGTSSYPIESKGIKWNGGTDSASIFYRLLSSDLGNLVFRTGDDTNCYFIWENANGSSLTLWMTLKGNTLTVSNLNGNASTTTKLQTARQINGTNFDGTANITTAKWGTARSIKIGNTAKNVDGSGNVSWSLSEIGAAAANHTHNYIVSRGNLNAQTGRTQSLGDVYSYNTISGNTGGPVTFTSVIGFGRGTAGTVEIAGGWTSGMGLWYRALRDVEDNWFGWRKVWDTGNFNPSNYSLTSHNHDDRYVNVTGDTMTGRLTFNDGGIATSTTTSLLLGMYTPTHIYLQTAGTLYYSPKSGTDYRIWHEGNFNPNNYMRAVNANGYYGMVTPLGDTSAWIRTTSSGILPFQKGDSTFGHCSIGSSTWYFYSAYILNIHSYRMEASDGFYQLSDIRLKENIQKITSMSNIELVEFIWKKDKKKSYGVIALQVEKYFPELVNIDKETGYKSVNYDAILIIKIALLENKIKQLESKLL